MNRFFKCRLAPFHLILDRIKEQLQVVTFVCLGVVVVFGSLAFLLATAATIVTWAGNKIHTLTEFELFVYQTVPWVWAVIGAGLFVLWLKSTFCR